MSNQSFTYGVNQALKANAFNKLGYSFDGWSAEADGSVVYEDGSQITLTENVTLFAVWEANSYTVTFNANGASNTMSNQTIQVNGTLKANTLVRTGYTFAGWSLTESGEVEYLDKASITIYEDTTLYAKWSPVEVTFVFNKNNANATGSMSNLVKAFASTFNLTSNSYELPGYTMTGWAYTANGEVVFTNGEEVTISISVYENAVNNTITLYAIWTPNTYTVIFNANNENATGSMTNLTFTYDVQKALTLNAFQLDNYRFTGWNTKDDGSGVSYTDGQSVQNLAQSGEVTLYAQWVVVTRNIVIVSTNGYTQDLNDVYGDTYTVINRSNTLIGGGNVNETILSLTPSKTGLTFIGFYTTAGLSSKITSETTYESEDETIYVYAYFAPILVFDMSDLGVSDVRVNLYQKGIQETYNGYLYAPTLTDIDGKLVFFGPENIKAINTNTTVKVYALDLDDSRIAKAVGDGATRYIVTLDDETVTIFNLFEGERTLPFMTNVSFLSDSTKAGFTVTGNQFDIAGSFSYSVVEDTDTSDNKKLYQIHTYPTYSSFSILSGYNDYQNLDFTGKRWLNTVKEAYKVGSGNIFKLRYFATNNESASISIRDISKTYEFTIGENTLSQEYMASVDFSELGTYPAYRYYYGDTTYLYIILVDYVDKGYDAIKFTEDASGKTISATVSPTFANANTFDTFEFEVNSGVNVESDAELKIAYADLDVEIINIHSRIKTMLNEDQYHEGTNIPYNFLINQAMKRAQVDDLPVGSAYVRAVKDNTTLTNLVINGNYFTIDGSDLPIAGLKDYETGEGYPDEGGAVNSVGSIFNAEDDDQYAGLWIVNVQNSMFMQYLTFNDTLVGRYSDLPRQLTEESDSKFVYGQQDNSITYNNMYIVSNTITPQVNEQVTESHTAADVMTEAELAAYNSGGYNAIMAESCAAYTNNVVIDYALIGLYPNGTNAKIDAKDTYVYYSWANSLYGHGSVDVSLTNCELRYSGGAALHLQDIDYNNGEEVITNGLGVEQTILHDPKLSIDRKTQVSNWVTAAEIWFRLYGLTAISGLMSGFNDYVNGISMASQTDPSGIHSIKKGYQYLEESDIAYSSNYENDNELFNFAIMFEDKGAYTDKQSNGKFSLNPTTFNNTLTIARQAVQVGANQYLTFTESSTKYGFAKNVLGDNPAYNMYAVPVCNISNFYDSQEEIQSGVSKGAYCSQYLAHAAYPGTDWANESMFGQGISQYGILKHDGTPTGYGWMELGFDNTAMNLNLRVYTYYYSGRAL